MPKVFSRQESIKMSVKMKDLKEDDFEKLKYIGEGAFGEVFLVRHREFNKVCAMKKIRKELILQNDGVMGVKTER